MLKEIRLHGRGGMGTVKAAEILVYSAVKSENFGNSIPFFGFERQGAPVTAFVRISDKPIRPKNQVYNPDIVVVLDPTIMNAVDVFEGVKEGAVLVLNSAAEINQLQLPADVKRAGIVNAGKIAEELLGRPITNTIILGCFVKTTGLVKLESVLERVGELFGEKNVAAVKQGYDMTAIYQL